VPGEAAGRWIGGDGEGARVDCGTGLPIVGMVGGGQLARMTHQAAIALGQSLRVLAVSPDDSAATVAADVRIGHHTDLDALRKFADGCTVVTFDHEHVPGEHLRALAAEGVTVLPGPDALAHAQDKLVMRRRLTDLGLPCPEWTEVPDVATAVAFGDRVGWPVVLKAARGGYDGRGVWVADDVSAATATVSDLIAADTPVLAEERVPLVRELAAMVARSPYGQVATWPVVQTVQSDGICVEVIAPAPDLAEDRAIAAQQLAIRIADALGVVGVLAVELFDTGDALLVNELAMRPHNAGHWTIEGSVTSQFTQHLRAVLDYPLGDTAARAPVTVMANVLGGSNTRLDETLHHLFAADPGVSVHLYGKAIRPGRKIGHVTVLGDGPGDLQRCRERAARAARWLREGRLREGRSDD
jgi:5-(carboxyamino)imidazole ribonucleotide synthase